MRRIVVNAELSPATNTGTAAGGVGHSIAHESAHKHVRGTAEYVDDLPLLPGTLFVATGQSSKPHARIRSLDLSAVKSAPGVIDVIVQSDIPGKIDVAPVYTGDPLLAGDLVEFIGQPIFAVAATSFAAAQRAVQLANIDYEELSVQLTVEDSLAAQSFVLPQHQLLWHYSNFPIQH